MLLLTQRKNAGNLILFDSNISPWYEGDYQKKGELWTTLMSSKNRPQKPSSVANTHLPDFAQLSQIGR